jgi:hypothetical protein
VIECDCSSISTPTYYTPPPTITTQPAAATLFDECVEQWPELAGKPFSACVEHFPMAVAIGVVNSDGSVVLKPDNDFPLTADTGIIVVAEDDDSYCAIKEPYKINVGSLPTHRGEADAPDRLLFVGWTDNVKGMLEILNTIFDPGTEVHLLNRTPIEERVSRLADQGMDTKRDLYNLEITHIVGNPAVWRTLKSLDLKSYRCMLVISDEKDSGDLMASDSHNLACILLLRHHNELTEVELSRTAMAHTGGISRHPGVREEHDRALEREKELKDNGGGSSGGSSGVATMAKRKKQQQEKGPISNQPIFCEILDTRTQKLIASHPTLGSSCHFLVSNRLISKVMAMVAEDRKVCAILNILLSGVISCMLKPSELYVGLSERVSFFVVAKRAQRNNQVVDGVGW